MPVNTTDYESGLKIVDGIVDFSAIPSQKLPENNWDGILC